MKLTLTAVALSGLCLITGACSKKQVPIAGGTAQIQAPVAPPAAVAPATQQAKATPAAKQNAPAAAQAKTAAAPATASAKRLTEQQRTDLNVLLAKLADAFFDYNATTIRPDASEALSTNVTAIRNLLAEYPAEKLLIEGHADERGSSEYNLGLADRRSRAAQEFLSSRGVPASQLSILSYGEEKPACSNQTEACFQQNRRVHIAVAP
jgi:peptidoglycan-associated lipoprotein